MPAFYRQSIQNAVNQQINIGKSKHRTTLNREAIGQVVSYCAVAAAHDLWVALLAEGGDRNRVKPVA